MAVEPPIVPIDMLVADAEKMLADSAFEALIVVDENGRVCGTFPRASE